MGYGTMYKDMKGPASGAQKAVGFAGSVQSGRKIREENAAKREAKAGMKAKNAQAEATRQAGQAAYGRKMVRGGSLPDK
jgi:hypothetical protein